MTLFLLIGAVCVSLGISALCSLLEATLLSLTPGNVADLKRQHPSAGATWEEFKKDVERPISVILILNTAAHTIGATVAGAEFESLMKQNGYEGGWTVFAFGAVFTVLMLQFTEILPKTLGVRHNTTVARFAAGPMKLLVKALSPVLALIRFVNKPFENDEAGRPDQTIEEIAGLAKIARSGQAIDAQQEQMIRAAGKLETIKVREITTRRRDVQVIRVNDDLTSQLKVLRESPFTRLPVVETSLDDVLGVVHLRDVFRLLDLQAGRINVRPDPERPDELVAIPGDAPGGEVHAIGTGVLDLRTILREVPKLPEVVPIRAALKLFQQGDSHMAIVIDEHGSADGIVTLEDVLEEVVGEIDDEFDDEHDNDDGENLNAHGRGYACGGEVPLRRVIDTLDLNDDLFEGTRVSTLGGWITGQLTASPRRGDVVQLGEHWRATVKGIDGLRITAIRIDPIDPGDEVEESPVVRD